MASYDREIQEIHAKLLDLEDNVKIIDRGVTLREERLRDTFAVHAPITYDIALLAWRKYISPLQQPEERTEFFNFWATLRYEWADAMLSARQGENKE